MVQRPTALVLTVTLVLLGCAKRPVLYPNETYEQLGDPAAQEIVTSCMDRAKAADVADTRTEGATKGAIGGGVVGAILGGAVGWIFGNPGRGAAAGAAHGGGTGAIGGAASSGESSDTFRNYVDTCLRKEGLEPIGWK